MRLNARSRTLIVSAATLSFVLAGSAVALADTADADDHPKTRTDRAVDQKHRIPDRPSDRPSDRPDHPDRTAIWKRCVQAAKSDGITDDTPEFRKICHRLLWRERAWKRCLHWAAEHPDLDIENRRELWRLCHRLLWNHRHAQ